MNACTIIARNYLAHARVLAESFREHHPRGAFTTLILDDPDGEIRAEEEPFNVLSPYEIGIQRDELHRMAMIYDVMELATAVKPWFLRTLLAAGATDVTYFDPDIEVLAPLDDVSELARRHSIVLIPHTLEPMPRDGREPSETTILYSGVYNLGFIAVAASAQAFLGWWSERLARECVLAPDEHRFVDQRWVDLVPGLFDHHVLRDPGCDVAHWNVHSRSLEWTGERYEVDGVPLRFYHFSGFDPEQPHILSKHQGQTPRVLLSDRPGLARLCREYAGKLLACGYRDACTRPYMFDRLPGGIAIDPTMRRAYRKALVAAEERDEPLPPDPFDSDRADAFVDWILSPPDAQGGAAKVSRYLRELYEARPDLQTAFPDLRWRDADHYLQWVVADGRYQVGIPDELLPRATSPQKTQPRQARTTLAPGINVTGFLRAELGIGEAARQLVGAIELTGIPFSTVTYTAITSSRQQHPFESASSGPVFDTNLICVNADVLPEFALDVGPDFFRDRYSIGAWWWEVSLFPATMHNAFTFVDEIWVGSEYVAKAISAATSKPVLTLPLPVRLPAGEHLPRGELGLPEQFLFLFSFDYLSVSERKNPMGLVEAFKRAFEPDEGPVLVIKSINGDKHAMELERLRAAAGERADILVIDKYVSSEEKDSYMAVCDCYVSLHRSEGFGLTMAEAMANGKPVIATAYSGNLEFMNEENSYLVPYRLATVPQGFPPYPHGAEWAEPDVAEAARLMRRVFDNPDEATERGRLAREDIRTLRSPQRAAEFISRRFEAIQRDRPERRASAVAAQRASLAAPPGSLQRAVAEVTRGPGALRISHSRWGAPVVFLRRVMQRALWPYMKSQHEVNAALVAALETHEAAQRQQANRLAMLEAEQRTSAEEFQRSTAALFETAERRIEEVRVPLEEHLARLTVDIERHLRSVEEHLAALTETIAALRGQSEGMRDELLAPPYMTDVSLLMTTDPEGRTAIGYGGGETDSRAGAYCGFEDIFRGPEELIRERQRTYVDLLRGRRPVLDAGCGRGEFLDLLREAEVPAHGVDVNAAMIARCREKGHDVEQADVNDYLERQADESLGAVFSAQVIEHLSYEELLRFLEVARRKLQPDGLLIAETVNPHSIQSFKTFWVDPTHRTPIFPEVAVALCRLSGFGSAYVLFPHGMGELEVDRREQGEYAVLATKVAWPAAPARSDDESLPAAVAGLDG